MAMVAPGRVRMASIAWYCCGVTPDSRLIVSLAARNRRSDERNPAKASYHSASSAIFGPGG